MEIGVGVKYFLLAIHRRVQAKVFNFINICYFWYLPRFLGGGKPAASKNFSCFKFLFKYFYIHIYPAYMYSRKWRQWMHFQGRRPEALHRLLTALSRHYWSSLLYLSYSVSLFSIVSYMPIFLTEVYPSIYILGSKTKKIYSVKIELPFITQ